MVANNDRWLDRWKSGTTGWHRAEVHFAVAAELERWQALGHKRALIPLCGKALELTWLARHGVETVGVELSPIAAAGVFDDAGMAYEVDEGARFTRFRGNGVTILCGDVFELLPADVGQIDVIWDRAAFVAIEPEQRADYVNVLSAVAPHADVLIATLEYDPERSTSPPFSVEPSVMQALYRDLDLLEDRDILGEEPKFADRGHTWFRRRIYRARLG